MNKIRISCAVFTYDQGKFKVLLSKPEIEVGTNWRILSGRLENDQNVDKAALRLLNEFGVTKNLFLQQLKTFVKPNVENTKEIVVVSYYALINMENYKLNSENLDHNRRWCSISEVPYLINNDNVIIDLSFYQLAHFICNSAIGFDLLPQKFTLEDVLNLYKEISGNQADGFGFCKKLVQKRILKPVVKKENIISSSNERLYTFNALAYDRLLRKEYVFNFHKF
ncbi:hypothetical protein [Flavobacterium sp. CSZ]|uniref:NrtR DNA-binding winged helix domain-containing protein n=1 Tax=Flavobacterium sp. CSZ TaxID=2783791 RepID=UPI00188D9C02|nr:hypothetical protein [Flavobacterium sp. CSZ]MBF4487785.1 hypothetical protein [Flavobacterium sp. CSZ]